MNLVFVTEARFIKNKYGNIYSVGGTFSNQLWIRYLESFDKIKVVARVQYGPDYPGEEKYLSNNQRVSFIELPYFIGPLEYFRKRRSIKDILKKSLPLSGFTYLCRVPGIIGASVIDLLKKGKIKYGLEVVGDPWDTFAPGSAKHMLRPLLRWQGDLSLKKMVKTASAVLYVTKFALQKRYPANQLVYTTFASNVLIDDSYEKFKPKKWSQKANSKIICVGTLGQMYKRPDVVLKAIQELLNEEISCELVWLGDGIFKTEMTKMAEKLKISDKVNFAGNVNSDQVRAFLNKSDIFILASGQEGLPRAMVEAMAVGLPCVGTKVGGIPELLDEQVLVTLGSHFDLASKIKRLISDEAFYNAQAKRNFEEAENYSEVKLNKRRFEFYEVLKKM